jgi:hypothetical protein
MTFPMPLRAVSEPKCAYQTPVEGLEVEGRARRQGSFSKEIGL